jgi:hypothetical protein
MVIAIKGIIPYRNDGLLSCIVPINGLIGFGPQSYKGLESFGGKQDKEPFFRNAFIVLTCDIKYYEYILVCCSAVSWDDIAYWPRGLERHMKGDCPMRILTLLS